MATRKIKTTYAGDGKKVMAIVANSGLLELHTEYVSKQDSVTGRYSGWVASENFTIRKRDSMIGDMASGSIICKDVKIDSVRDLVELLQAFLGSVDDITDDNTEIETGWIELD